MEQKTILSVFVIYRKFLTNVIQYVVIRVEIIVNRAAVCRTGILKEQVGSHMNSRKKFLSLLLAAVLAFSLAVPVFAATYTDLENHWAKEYMEDLAQRGYLKGYEDNTIRPNDNMTVCEALVLLSRFYKLDEEMTDAIYTDFGAFAEKTAGEKLSWAYEPLAICLAAGIVTQDELAALNLTAKIERELLAVFTVRAMQMEDSAESLASSELNFTDTASITASYRGHVVVLVMAGIVEGDDKGNFNPKNNITRGEVAALISRALDYIDTWELELTIEGYDGLVRSEGVITGVSTAGFYVRGYDGLTREYTLAGDAKVLVNGAEKSLTASYVGCYANVRENDGTVSFVSIKEDSDITWAQGTISQLSTASSNRQITVYAAESGKRTTYTIPSGAYIGQDGKEVSFSKLYRGAFVTLKVEDKVVSEVHAYTQESELKGTITTLSFGSTVTLRLTDTDGSVWRFNMDIADLPKITRGSLTISIDRLVVGDEVTMTMDSGEVTLIATTAKEAAVKGEITSIITTANSTSWTIKMESGESATYTVDNMAAAYSGEKSIALSAIKVGDTVSAVVYSSVITEVYLESALVSTDKLNGRVLVVDTYNKTLTILSTDNKLIYIDCTNTVSIISAVTGKSLGLSGIETDAELVAYGEYVNTNTFAAKSIIIEA
jgi:hypothetical protein